MSKKESSIKHIVLDVLKPHQPPLPEFATFLGSLEGTTRVDISVMEMDEKTETLRVILDGTRIDFEKLREHMSKQGAVVHSVDRVVVE